VNGKSIASEGIVRRISPDWQVETVADFSGDGKADILLRNSSTSPNILYLYQMDGKSIASEGIVRRISSNWQVETVADFSGDGKADILLRNSNVSPNILYLYQMNGKSIAAEGIVRRVSADWQVEKVADFSGDGKADILLRNSSVTPNILYLYQMNGKAIASEGIVRRISSDWQVEKVADFSGDGKADILLRNSNASPNVLYMYTMDGKAIASEGIVRRISSDWVSPSVDEVGPTPPSGETYTVPLSLPAGATELVLKKIPAGTFTMGSPDSDSDAYSNEKPQHSVTISKDFYMGVYEVTQAQFEAVTGSDPSGFSGNNRPVETVSWHDAQDFIEALNTGGYAPERLRVRIAYGSAVGILLPGRHDDDLQLR
jgi:hypothetical protein